MGKNNIIKAFGNNKDNSGDCNNPQRRHYHQKQRQHQQKSQHSVSVINSTSYTAIISVPLPTFSSFTVSALADDKCQIIDNNRIKNSHPNMLGVNNNIINNATITTAARQAQILLQVLQVDLPVSHTMREMHCCVNNNSSSNDDNNKNNDDLNNKVDNKWDNDLPNTQKRSRSSCENTNEYNKNKDYRMEEGQEFVVNINKSNENVDDNINKNASNALIDRNCNCSTSPSSVSYSLIIKCRTAITPNAPASATTYNGKDNTSDNNKRRLRAAVHSVLEQLELSCMTLAGFVEEFKDYEKKNSPQLSATNVSRFMPSPILHSTVPITIFNNNNTNNISFQEMPSFSL